MTSNEKKILVKFKELKQANTVTMAGTLRVTINYAYDVCNKLCEKGYLERLSPGRFALYRITSLGEEQIKTDVPTEEEMTESLDSSSLDPEGSRDSEERDKLREGVPPAPSVVEESDSEEEKTGILDHPSVPEEWTTCNWKWKAGGKNE